jgi:hypothetical protein
MGMDVMRWAIQDLENQTDGEKSASPRTMSGEILEDQDVD